MSRPPFLRPGARAHLGAAVRLAWRSMRHGAVALRLVIGQTLAALLALLVMFWEWGWRPLAALLGQLARLKPIARLEEVVRGLPPYAALAVFALPSVLILPLKLLALYLIAHGQKAAAVALFVGAKVVGTALVARIFMLTQTTLMRIGWFKRAYEWLMPIKAALLAWVRESAAWRVVHAAKDRVKAWTGPWIAQARSVVAQVRDRLLRRRS